jgi:hypothetical protein
VKANEHDAKSPSTRTGRVAAFCARLGVDGSDAPSHRRAFLAAFLVCGLLLAAFVAPAVAAPPSTRVYTGLSFGPDGTPGSSFANLQSIAVDQTDGDVCVLDTGNGGKVYKFDSAGHPVDFTATGTKAIDALVSV